MFVRRVVAIVTVVLFMMTSPGAGVAAQSTPAPVPACAEPPATPTASSGATVAATADDHGDHEDEHGDAASVITDADPVCSVTVELFDIGYSRSDITVPAGEPVEMVFTNTGKLDHDFTADDLDLDIDVDPGETVRVVVNIPAGDYRYQCDQTGHASAGMHGTLHAVPAD